MLFMRMLALSSAAVVVLAVLGALGFHFFQGWRARDLSGKALESFEAANYRAAWLQMNSARGLRPDDPLVLRAAAIIESRFGLPSAMEIWDRYASVSELSKEDLVERGRAAAALGNDEQFEKAVSGLDAAGDAASAGRLRSARSLERGNLDRAIDETRRTIAAADDPALRLDLAKLLLRRNLENLAAAPDDPENQRIAQEMFAIIDGLQATSSENEALAFGLSFLLPDREKQARWAELAMSNPDPENPALLPAATVMIDLGKAQPDDLHKTLRPIFDAALLDQRAAFVAWLTRHGMAQESLTLITAKEAGESAGAFIARTDALARLGKWDAVIETVDAGGNAPLSLRLATKARAEYALRQGAQSGAKSLADALRAAVREGTVPVVAKAGDDMGGQVVVDQTLVELCGDSSSSASIFAVVRDRLSRRGPEARAMLAEAHARALVASPNAVPVQDYSRYLKLLAPFDEDASEEEKTAVIVDPEDTAQAVAAAPADPAVRTTHALALWRAGRPDEALAAFDDFTVFFGRVPPGLQAVICRILADGGHKHAAETAVQTVDKTKLTANEAKLLSGLN